MNLVNFKATRELLIKIYLLDYCTDKNFYFVCIPIFLLPLRQRNALLRSANFTLVLKKFVVSDYGSFRFLLNFSACFCTVFVQPGAAPPVNARISGTKLLCSTSRFFCCYLNVLTLLIFAGVRYNL